MDAHLDVSLLSLLRLLMDTIASSGLTKYVYIPFFYTNPILD